MADLPDLLELHRRMLAGDGLAPYDVVEALRVPLLRRMESRFQALRADQDLEGFVLEALAEYCDKPERFQPDRGTLDGFIWLIAYRNALNELQKQGKLDLQFLESEKVAQELDRRNTSRDGLDARFDDGLPDEVTLPELKARVWGAVKERDRPILELMLANEASHENCVAALELEREPPESQKRQVKNARDRVQAAYQRTREHYEKERAADG